MKTLNIVVPVGELEEQPVPRNTTVDVRGLLDAEKRDKLDRLSSYVQWHCKVMDSDPDIDAGLLEVFNHIRSDLDFITSGCA
ncbi:hypothetical protein [Endozoicomonas lisbonensis]|uniref:hypothetical protein n=1 Tax=Endozoicomonas lisbonensis TaxID=3120522 RepID=UPI00339ABD16